jgi:pimeloyl-ACP methyl ester carboxylesterase
MITLPSYCRTAALLMILTSTGAAGDLPPVATVPDRVAASPPRKDPAALEPDGLDTRRSYERGKVPVVLIHGLWGTPQLWDPMIADLEGDPAIGKKYQFWTFRYASGDSIPYSAHLLRESLRRARRSFDPDGTDLAFDQMVVVGHSLGGILAKMMAQSSGSRLWQTISARPINQVAGPPDNCRLLQQAYFYEPVPEVRRVVFITTPHRGSPLASSPLKGIGVRLCVRKSCFSQALESMIVNNGSELFIPRFLAELPTSAGELASAHPLLLGVCKSEIDPRVRCHSIIADLRDPPAPGGTDGIVPYSSSHLDGVASELLVRGLHICLNHPAVIHEVRRILLEHAGNESMARTVGRPHARPDSAVTDRPRKTHDGASGSAPGHLHGLLFEVQP